MGVAQHLTDGGALFHIVRRVAGHPVVGDAQLLQQVEGRRLLGQQLPLGRVLWYS